MIVVITDEVQLDLPGLPINEQRGTDMINHLLDERIDIPFTVPFHAKAEALVVEGLRGELKRIRVDKLSWKSSAPYRIREAFVQDMGGVHGADAAALIADGRKRAVS